MQPLTRRMTAAFAVVTAFGVLTVSAAAGTALTEPGPITLAWTLALLLWLQRRYPLTGLLIGIAAIAALRTSFLTEAGWLWPATLLYVQAALARSTRTVVIIATVNALTAFVMDWTVLSHTAREATAGVGTDALWLCAALAITVSYRNWRRLQAESLQRLRTELEEQRTAERLRLAHEVHDAVAHTLAVVGVHVNVAADALDSDPDEAHAALRLAQDVRRRAMADLSALVGVLRAPGDGTARGASDGTARGTGDRTGRGTSDRTGRAAGDGTARAAGDRTARGTGDRTGRAAGDGAGVAAPGNESAVASPGNESAVAPPGSESAVAPPVVPPDLAGLVQDIRSTGLDAVLEVDGSADDLPLPVLLVTAAIVRESLTNVVKHAEARRVTVRVHYGPHTEIFVNDDGNARLSSDTGRRSDNDPSWPGNGLRGLAERVAALDGTFSAGAGRDGFAVHAKIPA